MKWSSIVVLKRSLDPQEAAEYVGGMQLLKEYQAAGWLKPYVQRHRLTRYDRDDLDRCINRHKVQDPTNTENCT
jgi:hypothetical protein